MELARFRLAADAMADMVRVTACSKGLAFRECLGAWEDDADVQML